MTLKIAYFSERVEPAPQVGDQYTPRDTDPDRARVCDTTAEVLELRTWGALVRDLARVCE